MILFFFSYRFHVSAEFDLRSAIQPTTDELAPKLAPGLEQIQKCLIALLRKALIEIKKVRTVDMSELTLEDCCFKESFDYKLQELLDPVWAELPFERRHYVQVRLLFHSDMRTIILLFAPINFEYISVKWNIFDSGY